MACCVEFCFVNTARSLIYAMLWLLDDGLTLESGVTRFFGAPSQ
jgi:hypothetical protein